MFFRAIRGLFYFYYSSEAYKLGEKVLKFMYPTCVVGMHTADSINKSFCSQKILTYEVNGTRYIKKYVVAICGTIVFVVLMFAFATVFTGAIVAIILYMT
jgi:hypothetical protein